MTKGQIIIVPATVVECPPLKAIGVVLYKNSIHGSYASSQILAEKIDNELKKKISIPKKANKKEAKPEDCDDVRLLVYTQPKLTGTGKKKPEIFEIAMGGKKEDKLKLAMEKLGKEINVNEVLAEGQQVDIHSVSKGKGLQGPVKRDGIGLKSHKSEKSRRRAVIGIEGEGKVAVGAHQDGQLGYHTRTEYNKWVMKIGEDPKDVNPKGGFIRFGNLKNSYVLLKGSVPGPSKRLIRINTALRPNTKLPKEAFPVEIISRESRQRR
jgi:large subunit ribosomal protein L3